MAKSEYQRWMDKRQESVTVSISLSASQVAVVTEEFKSLTGSTNYYDNPELYDSIVTQHKTEIVLPGVSLNEAQAFAEPLRILYPDLCVSLYTRDGSFIGNTSWNDQMKMFWEYPVFTAVGEQLKQVRTAEAAEKNLIASWE
jgi:hypothetical protein